MSITATIPNTTARTIISMLRHLNTAYQHKLTGTLTINNGTIYAWLKTKGRLVGRLTLTNHTIGDTSMPIMVPVSQFTRLLTPLKGRDTVITINDQTLTGNNQAMIGETDPHPLRLPETLTPGLPVNAVEFQQAVIFGTTSPATRHDYLRGPEDIFTRAHIDTPLTYEHDTITIETTNRSRASYATVTTTTNTLNMLPGYGLDVDVKPLRATANMFAMHTDGTITITASSDSRYAMFSDSTLTILLPNAITDHHYPINLIPNYANTYKTHHVNAVSTIDTHTLTRTLTEIIRDKQVSEVECVFTPNNIHLHPNTGNDQQDIIIPATTIGNLQHPIILNPRWLNDMVKALDMIGQPNITFTIPKQDRDPILITTPNNERYQALICTITHNYYR